jgi:hypothetical protein
LLAIEDAYLPNDAANRGTSLGSGDVGLHAHALVVAQSHVAEAVVVVKAAFSWKLL